MTEIRLLFYCCLTFYLDYFQMSMPKPEAKRSTTSNKKALAKPIAKHAESKNRNSLVELKRKLDKWVSKRRRLLYKRRLTNGKTSNRNKITTTNVPIDPVSVSASAIPLNLSRLDSDAAGHVFTFLNAKEHTYLGQANHRLRQIGLIRWTWGPKISIDWDFRFSKWTKTQQESLSKDVLAQMHMTTRWRRDIFERYNFYPCDIALCSWICPLQIHVMFLLQLGRQHRSKISRLNLYSSSRTNYGISYVDFREHTLQPLMISISELTNLKHLALNFTSTKYKLRLPLHYLAQLEQLESLELSKYIHHCMAEQKEYGNMDLFTLCPKLKYLTMCGFNLIRFFDMAEPIPGYKQTQVDYFLQTEANTQTEDCKERKKAIDEILAILIRIRPKLDAPLILETLCWKNCEAGACQQSLMPTVVQRFKKSTPPAPLKKFTVEFRDLDDECCDMDSFYDMVFHHADTLQIFEMGCHPKAPLKFKEAQLTVFGTCLNSNMPTAFHQLCLRQERALGRHKFKSIDPVYFNRVYHDKPSKIKILAITCVIFEDEGIFETIRHVLAAFPSLERLVFVDCQCTKYQSPAHMRRMIFDEGMDPNCPLNDDSWTLRHHVEGPLAPLEHTTIVDEINQSMEHDWACKVEFTRSEQYKSQTF